MPIEGAVGIERAHELRVGIVGLGFAGDDQYHFALEVDASEIVVGELGGVDAVSGEDDRAAGGCRAKTLTNPAEVAVKGEGVIDAIDLRRPCGVLMVEFAGDDVHALEVGAVVADRFQAEAHELGGDVVGGDVVFGAGDVATG